MTQNLKNFCSSRGNRDFSQIAAAAKSLKELAFCRTQVLLGGFSLTAQSRVWEVGALYATGRSSALPGSDFQARLGPAEHLLSSWCLSRTNLPET